MSESTGPCTWVRWPCIQPACPLWARRRWRNPGTVGTRQQPLLTHENIPSELIGQAHLLPRPQEAVGGPQYLLSGKKKKKTETEAQMAWKLSAMETGSMEAECQSWQTPPGGTLAPSPHFLETLLQCSCHVFIKQLLQPQTPRWAQLGYLILAGARGTTLPKRRHTLIY